MFMAVSRAVIKTLCDIRVFRAFYASNTATFSGRRVQMGKRTFRVRSGTALTKMACGLQAAGGVICQQNAVTDVDPRRSPGEHQACSG